MTVADNKCCFWGSVTIYTHLQYPWVLERKKKKKNAGRSANSESVKHKNLTIVIIDENLLSVLSLSGTTEGGFSLDISKMPSERQGNLG